MDLVVLSDSRILYNGAVYKRQITTDGRYNQAKRREYMREWRKKQRLVHVPTDIVILSEEQ
jgi:hypothetical protein